MDVLISQAGFFLIMADHDDRHIGMLPHFLEPFPDDLAIRFIQGARHFIEQEDFRLKQDVADQSDTLYFPA